MTRINKPILIVISSIGKRCFATLSMTIVFGLLLCCNINLLAQDSTNHFKSDTLIKIKGIDIFVPIYRNGINDPDNFDVHLFRSINNNRSKFKDALISVIDKTVMPMGLLMPLGTFIYGKVNKKTYDENTGYLLAVSEITELGITFGIKHLVKRKRPYEALTGVYKGDNYTLDRYSFPSGHTSTSFSIATMFALRYPKYPQVYAPIYLWSLIIAYGRPYLGMHYPSDVLGGAVIGAGSSILIYSLRKELFTFKNNILKEENKDDGSINGGVVSIFAASFLVSEIVNVFIFKSSKISLGVNPSGSHNSDYSINLNWKF